MIGSGRFVPSIVIFPRKKINKQSERDSTVGKIVTVHPFSWIQENLFSSWFQRFLKVKHPTEDSNFTVVRQSLFAHQSDSLLFVDKTFMEGLKRHYSKKNACC